MCVYQGVSNVSFKEIFAYVLNGWLPVAQLKNLDPEASLGSCQTSMTKLFRVVNSQKPSCVTCKCWQFLNVIKWRIFSSNRMWTGCCIEIIFLATLFMKLHIKKLWCPDRFPKEGTYRQLTLYPVGTERTTYIKYYILYHIYYKH